MVTSFQAAVFVFTFLLKNQADYTSLHVHSTLKVQAVRWGHRFSLKR